MPEVTARLAAENTDPDSDRRTRFGQRGHVAVMKELALLVVQSRTTFRPLRHEGNKHAGVRYA